MSHRTIDVAIIGAGTAGMSAFRAAKVHTDSVLLIEGAQVGTTCARVGCMPSKLLIAAAEAAHHARHTQGFGIQVSDVRVEGAAVMQRVQRERDRFVGFVTQAVESFGPSSLLRAQVRFRDAGTLVTETGETISAKRIVIATGSTPFVPPMLKAVTSRLLTNESIFELPDLPKSLVVFGPGVIGLELGQAMSRLGVEVKVFGLGGGVVGIRDPQIRDYALKAFNEEFYLDASASIESVQETAQGVEVRYQHKSGDLRTETFDYALAATGRIPSLAGLQLENAGLELTERGIPTFDRFTLQCGKSSIFIAGDASADIPLLHEAADQGRIAGDNAGRFPDVRAGQRRTPLGVVFTEPQVAQAGLTLPQVQARGAHSYAQGVASFEDQGRSRVMLRNKGLLKVYAEQGSGVFLGAEMFGPAAEHIGHLLAWAVQKRMTVSEMLDMPFYHPVIEEGVRTALRDLNHQLHIGPAVVKNCLDCGPGG